MSYFISHTIYTRALSIGQQMHVGSPDIVCSRFSVALSVAPTIVAGWPRPALRLHLPYPDQKAPIVQPIDLGQVNGTTQWLLHQ
jgi:hypothetical protein